MKKETDFNLTFQIRRKLKKRFKHLAEKLSDKNLTKLDREEAINEMTFINNVCPQVMIKPIDISGVFAGLGAAIGTAIMTLVAVKKSYDYSNEGKFDSNGNELLKNFFHKKI